MKGLSGMTDRSCFSSQSHFPLVSDEVSSLWNNVIQELRVTTCEHGIRKRIMDQLTLDLWRECWYRYMDSIMDPMKLLVIEHIGFSLGVFDNSYFDTDPSITVHPEDVTTIFKTVNQFGVQVEAYINDNNIFNGFVISEEQIKTCFEYEHWDELCSNMRLMEARDNPDTGLSLFIYMN